MRAEWTWWTSNPEALGTNSNDLLDDFESARAHLSTNATKGINCYLSHGYKNQISKDDDC
jgi:hypothetical protein